MSLSLLPETKALVYILLSSGNMNGAVERERKERCLHVFVYTFCMQKSVLQQCLPPKYVLLLACSRIAKHTYTNTNIHVLYIFSSFLYMHVSMYMLLSLTTEWKLMFLNVKAPPILPSLMSNITCSAQDQLL